MWIDFLIFEPVNYDLENVFFRRSFDGFKKKKLRFHCILTVKKLMVCMLHASNVNSYALFSLPETLWIPLVQQSTTFFLFIDVVLHNFYQSSKSLTHYLLPLIYLSGVSNWTMYIIIMFIYMSVCHKENKGRVLSRHVHCNRKIEILFTKCESLMSSTTATFMTWFN